MKILTATTQEEIDSCYPVMSQLRPGTSLKEFQERVERQFKNGYQLAYLIDNGSVKAVAGYHISSSLAWRKFLYIEDLIADKDSRSQGYGKALLDWLTEKAQQQQCDQLHLDSGVQRIDAHRFYEREGMQFASKHFSLLLK